MKKKEYVNPKQQQFEEAVRKFEASDKTAQDYFDFIVVANRVLRPDSGLLWEQILEGLNKVLGGEKRVITEPKRYSLVKKRDCDQYEPVADPDGQWIFDPSGTIKLDGD